MVQLVVPHQSRVSAGRPTSTSRLRMWSSSFSGLGSLVFSSHYGLLSSESEAGFRLFFVLPLVLQVCLDEVMLNVLGCRPTY